MEKITFIALGLLALGFFVSFWPLPFFYNNYKTWNFLRSLKSVELPQSSSIIDSYSRFGILWGNSNHCDVEVGVLVESDLDPTDFVAQINQRPDLNYPHHDGGLIRIYLLLDGAWEVMEETKSAEATSQNESDKAFLLNFAKNIDVGKAKSLYTLTAYDQTYSGYGFRDLRCH